MDKIENLQQYEEAVIKVEELLSLVNESTPTDDPNYIELHRLSSMIMDYEDNHSEPNEETMLAIEEAIRGEGKPVDLSSMDAFLKSMDLPDNE